MKRRRFLATAGSVGVIPALWYSTRSPRETIEIRYWLSAAAAAYDVHEQLREYITRALEPPFRAVEVTYGGVVGVDTEDGYEVSRSGEWPRKVLEGHVHPDGVSPARDVNLLVTDGSMRDAPTGVAMTRLASIGGARRLERVPRRGKIDDIVPLDPALLAMQIVIHEIGHVLGLSHDHGRIDEHDGGTVATPMVSSYAWSADPPAFLDGRCACGDAYPREVDGERFLSFVFSACARRELQRYGGGFGLRAR